MKHFMFMFMYYSIVFVDYLKVCIPGIDLHHTRTSTYLEIV